METASGTPGVALGDIRGSIFPPRLCIPKGPRKMKCPVCGNADIHRSHRRGLFERMLSLILLRPFRCMDCNKRFWRFARGKKYRGRPSAEPKNRAEQHKEGTDR